ncbi:MAG: D-aminopeptidase [Holosporales bacterium]
MFKVSLSYLFLIAALFCKTKEAVKDYMPTFEKKIIQIKDAYKAPGVGVAIVKDGEIVFEKAWGTKENGKNAPIDNDTVFQIASLSKTFLTFVIAQLVDEGVLTFETKVADILPELQFEKEDVQKNLTVLDLLTHCLGLPPFAGDTLWHLDFSPKELLGALKHVPFKHKFRERYTYQNHMFGAASLLVERVTKKTIAQLFDERIFKPLGMKNASVGIEPLQAGFFGLSQKNVAKPHDIRDGKIYTKDFSPKTYLFPGSSGVNLSIKDAAIWLKFVMDGYKHNGKEFLKEKTVTYMQTPKVPCHFSDHDLQFSPHRFSKSSYDIGLFESQYGPDPKNIWYGHMGGFNGVRSYMGFMKSQNVGLIVISNYGSMNVSLMPEVIRNFFLDWYLDLKNINWLDEITATSNKWIGQYNNNRIQNRLSNPVSARNSKDYVGTYTHPLYGKIKIEEDGKNLKLFYRDKTVTITHWNENEFSLKPYELASTYNDYDLCTVYFSFNPKEKVRMYIGQMFEGQKYFEKE